MKPAAATHHANTLFDELCSGICTERRRLDKEVIKQFIVLAVEIAREGREGRKIGALFVIGDEDAVFKHSRPLILDPLFGHPEDAKSIFDHNTRETVKELAQLDGAFLASDSGTVLSACRYIDAVSEGVALPLGLGSRHMAAASITRTTRALAVVVSQSSMVRVFDRGKLISEIIPEVWMLNHYSVTLDGPYSQRTEKDVTVLARNA